MEKFSYRVNPRIGGSCDFRDKFDMPTSIQELTYGICEDIESIQKPLCDLVMENSIKSKCSRCGHDIGFQYKWHIFIFYTEINIKSFNSKNEVFLSYLIMESFVWYTRI